VPALNVEILADKSSTMRSVVFNTDLLVRYTDAQDGVHEARVQSDSLLESMPGASALFEPLPLRYDPQDFSRVSLEGFSSMSYGPWLWIAGMVGLSLLFAASVYQVYAGRIRWAQAAYRAALAREELVCDLVRCQRMSQSQKRGRWPYQVTFRVPGEAKTREVQLPECALPLRNAYETKVLALRPNGSETLVLLDASLRPFAFEQEQRRAIIAAFQAA
jgi:hypothetical protein